MDQYAGSEDNIEKSIGKRDLKRCRQRQLGELRPVARPVQCVLLNFDPIELSEPHFAQCAQLVSLVAAYLEDAGLAWYIRQEAPIEFAPGYAKVFAIESVERSRGQRIAVGIRPPEIAPPML